MKTRRMAMSKKSHESLVLDAMAAVDRVHSDTLVDAGETRESLQSIRSHIELLLEALESIIAD